MTESESIVTTNLKKVRNLTREEIFAIIDPNLAQQNFEVTDAKWELLKKFVNNLKNIENIPFHTMISELLLELPKSFNQSKKEWSEEIDKAIQDQRGKLGSLFKQPILPDHFKGFSDIGMDLMLRGWTYHFNELKIPENKGSVLIDLLSNDISVRRGNEFGFGAISLIDLSTSGKTYTMFQLVNSIPTKTYKSFFVIHIYESTQFCQTLIEFIKSKRRPMSELVALFVLTLHITIKTLVESELDVVNPLDFLKHKGDGCLKEIFKKLVFSYFGSNITLLTKELARELKEKFIKVVFSFDEAQTLLDYKDESTWLFNELYNEIRHYNNPVFIGTTFSVSNSVLNVCQEGRHFMFPLIGTHEPWYLNDVDKMLSQMFNIEDFKKDYKEDYLIMCYLLSGAPENVVRFHQALYLYSNIYEDTVALFRKCLEQVVQFKQERSAVRLLSFLNDTSIMDSADHLLKLIFNREVDEELMDDLSDMITSKKYRKAFIEKTIAFVVRKGSRFSFEIVDPMIAKSYVTILVAEHTTALVNFMQANFTKRGEDFELFMILLLLLESVRLKDQPMIASPLFASETCLSKYQLITRTFLSDKHLSQFSNIPSVWYCQLATQFFKDAYVTLENNMGPNGLFYLKYGTELKHATCVMTLASDGIRYQTKVINLFKSLSLSNDGTQRVNNTVPCVGWIVAPNMKRNLFTESNLRKEYASLNSETPIDDEFSCLQDKSLELVVTVSGDISQCIECHRSAPYYENLKALWKKLFKKKGNNRREKNVK